MTGARRMQPCYVNDAVTPRSSPRHSQLPQSNHYLDDQEGERCEQPCLVLYRSGALLTEFVEHLPQGCDQVLLRLEVGAAA